MDKRANSDRSRAPQDKHKDFEPSPLPFGPDGKGMPSTPGPFEPTPAATPENTMCLRGPCRHYWQLETFFAFGNPKGTFGGKEGLREAVAVDLKTGKVTYSDELVPTPRQLSRSCTVQPGMETELEDDCVYGCSRWDPLTPRELRKLARRRRRFYKQHPALRPKGNLDGTR